MGGSTKGLFELLQRHPLALSAAPARQKLQMALLGGSFQEQLQC